MSSIMRHTMESRWAFEAIARCLSSRSPRLSRCWLAIAIARPFSSILPLVSGLELLSVLQCLAFTKAAFLDPAADNLLRLADDVAHDLRGRLDIVQERAGLTSIEAAVFHIAFEPGKRRDHRRGQLRPGDPASHRRVQDWMLDS